MTLHRQHEMENYFNDLSPVLCLHLSAKHIHNTPNVVLLVH